MASLSGKRKVAMLLMSLDQATATELLKGQPQEVVQSVALELSHLDAAGTSNEEAVNVAKEFCTSLQKSAVGGMHIRSFVDTVLKGSAGKEKAEEMQQQMQQALHDKDPFLAIGAASPAQIAISLANEPPQAIALVLSNISPRLSTEVLSRLNEDISKKAVWRMTKPGDISSKTIRRVGEMICKKLVDLTSEEGMPYEETLPKEILRKVAIVLSGLDKSKRDSLLETIQVNDDAVAKTVQALMVTWEDIIKIEDRSLQEALRKVDAGVLAKALYGSDPIIAEKIRSNISQRAAEMVDEETGLMSEPRKKEVLEAQELVVQPLRDANEAEELLFIEEE
ncbi:MAG: hypothetical protein KAJ07_12370 [Planctomycetes bacterium]|nr:hypothetical protein [Planctomycetota bacterium]